MITYKIVDLSLAPLTMEQWAAGNTHPSTARYSYVIDENGDVILNQAGKSMPGTKVVLKWEGDEPESLIGVGTNYTLQELEVELEKPEWVGPVIQ